MPRIPRDLSGRELARVLKKYSYKIVRQSGSHIRLESNLKKKVHNIIKIGTLNSILTNIAGYIGIPKNKLIEELFER